MEKKEYLESFIDKNFDVNYVKIKDNIFYCVLDHNLKFSKVFSDYLVSKVFNSKNIKEQKSFVTYPMVAVKALQDVIKGNFTKTYIVDYVFTIVSKQKKNEKLLKYLDNDIMKEKVVLKINYNEYVLNRDKVYELIRKHFYTGVNFAVTWQNDSCDCFFVSCKQLVIIF